MEYRITPAVDRCTALTLRFLAASWWKINLLLSSFPRFSPVFMSVYIYLLYSGVWRLQGSSYICISVKLDPFRCLAHDRKSPPQRRISSLNICGKEVDLARNLFHKQRICHQKSINIQQSLHLGHRATLYHDGLINVNRNLDKAVYEKEDFKRRDRQRSLSICFRVFIRQFWNRVRKRDSCLT